MRIRIHKDIVVRWTIKTNGQDVPLTGRDIAIVLTDPYEYRRELAYEVESGNVAVLTWRGMDQSKLGNYTISAVENCGKPYESAVDAVNFVTLVARTDEEDQQQSAEGLDTEGVTLTGNIQIITGNTTDFDLLINRPKYDGAVMTHLTDIKPAQRAVMPTAAAALLGAIYQYIGATTEDYTNGFFYKCVSDGQETPTYSWSVINIQPVAATDFDQLVNRPKYNGVSMTHNTDVPEVKTATWDGKYTKPSGGIPSSDLAAAVVSSLNNADNAAAGVTAINDKIPAQATSSNKLADKDFVNSSINSVTAYYITADASGNAFATKAALLAGPYYNQGEERVPTRNDYALVNADESHDNAAVRYVYDGSAWVYQYKVNDTPFTAAQLAAINSGITAELVAKIHDREIFEATYDATTYAEITAALAAGKFVILMTGSTRGYLSYIENGVYYFTTTTSYIYMWKVTSADVWSTIISAQIETMNHRVTTLSAQSTDNEYPTAKCVYDAIISVINSNF